MSDEMKCFNLSKYIFSNYENYLKIKYLVSLCLGVKFGDGYFG